MAWGSAALRVPAVLTLARALLLLCWLGGGSGRNGRGHGRAIAEALTSPRVGAIVPALSPPLILPEALHPKLLATPRSTTILPALRAWLCCGPTVAGFVQCSAAPSPTGGILQLEGAIAPARTRLAIPLEASQARISAASCRYAVLINLRASISNGLTVKQTGWRKCWSCTWVGTRPEPSKRSRQLAPRSSNTTPWGTKLLLDLAVPGTRQNRGWPPQQSRVMRD
mmetsp:Transcript_106048/g.265582  ORF Transcript_106048/g.265582 Transcript_106048/m.265582 type:complete len:225 (+) Transcript_106048:2045-2719(+)